MDLPINKNSSFPFKLIAGSIASILVLLLLFIGITKLFSENPDLQKKVLGSQVIKKTYGPPEVKSLSPASGTPSTTVTIKGKNLRDPESGKAPLLYPGKVFFDSSKEENPPTDGLSDKAVEALPTNWTDEEVTVYVPVNAKEAAAKVYLQFSEDEEKEPLLTKGLDFKVFRPTPKIESLSPEEGFPSSVASVVGTGFGNLMQGSNKFSNPYSPLYPGKVLFGKTEAQIITWSSEEIEVYIPDSASNNKVVVSLETALGEVTSNPFEFKLATPNPKITEISKDSIFPTDQIIVSGEGFGDTMIPLRGGPFYPGKVSIGGKWAIINSWSDKNISIWVPPTVKDGEAEIKVARFFQDKNFPSKPVKVLVNKPNPQINKISPSTEKATNIVTIEGEGFGNSIRTPRETLYPGEVFFASVKAYVAGNWSDRSISVFVPPSAKIGSVPISLDLNNIKSNSIPFEVKELKPAIEEITPPKFLPGERVTLKGSGFGYSMKNPIIPFIYPGAVYFGGIKAKTVEGAWSENSVTVFAPFNTKTGLLSLGLDSWGKINHSNKVSYEVIKPTPKIEKVKKLVSNGRRRLVILGENLGEIIGSSSADKERPGEVVVSRDNSPSKKGKRPLAPTSWSKESISLDLPKDVSGFVFVELRYQDGKVSSEGLEIPK